MDAEYKLYHDLFHWVHCVVIPPGSGKKDVLKVTNIIRRPKAPWIKELLLGARYIIAVSTVVFCVRYNVKHTLSIYCTFMMDNAQFPTMLPSFLRIVHS